jgi:hypothetical protein
MQTLPPTVEVAKGTSKWRLVSKSGHALSPYLLLKGREMAEDSH